MAEKFPPRLSKADNPAKFGISVTEIGAKEPVNRMVEALVMDNGARPPVTVSEPPCAKVHTFPDVPVSWPVTKFRSPPVTASVFGLVWVVPMPVIAVTAMLLPWKRRSVGLK